MKKNLPGKISAEAAKAETNNSSERDAAKMFNGSPCTFSWI